MVRGVRYIDDAVMRQVSAAFTDSPAAGEFPAVLSVSWDDAIDEEEGRTAKRWWYLTDVQFSVVGLIDPTWGSMVTERVEYSPYGVPLYQPATDFDGDGDVDTADEFAFLDAWYAQFGGSGIGPGPASADRDRSGAVDVGDLFDFLDAWFADFPVGGPGAPEGWISRKEVPPSMGVQDGPLGPDNPVGYCGYIHNPETGDYTVRFRHYSPRLGRWLEPDPVGYFDGPNRASYVNGLVTMATDAMGLFGLLDKAWNKAKNLCRGGKRVGKGIYYGIGSSCSDSMALEAEKIWDFNVETIETLIELAENRNRLENAAEIVARTAVQELGDVPPCVLLGIAKEFGLDVAEEASIQAGSILVKSIIVNALMKYCASRIRESILDHIRPGRAIRGGGGPMIVVIGYSCYGYVEELQNASDRLQSLSPGIWNKLRTMNMHSLSLFLEPMLGRLSSLTAMGKESLIKRYCCSEKPNEEKPQSTTTPKPEDIPPPKEALGRQCWY